MYLITLSYTSPQSPSFFMARDTLSKKHHISESFISDGTKELRRLNLLDIKYGDLEGKTYNQRLANVYTPKPLYNPQDLKKTLADLQRKGQPVITLSEKMKRNLAQVKKFLYKIRAAVCDHLPGDSQRIVSDPVGMAVRVAVLGFNG